MKMVATRFLLCHSLSQDAFLNLLKAAQNYEFEEEPDYDALCKQFFRCCGVKSTTSPALFQLEWAGGDDSSDTDNSVEVVEVQSKKKSEKIRRNLIPHHLELIL